MNTINQVSETMTEYVNNSVDFVKTNKIVGPILAMLLVLYAVYAAPKLPKAAAKIFDYSAVKIVYMFLIAYIATKDPSVAIVTAVGLFIAIQTLSAYDTSEKIVKAKVESNGTKKEAIVKAEAHEKAANEAASKGEMDKANAHVQEAKNQRVKAEAIDKAIVHRQIASEAISEGNKTKAETHMVEAGKQELKIQSVNQSEMHKAKAFDAMQEGNMKKAQLHVEEASKHEATVASLSLADAHKVAAQQLLQQGDNAKAEFHAKESAKHEAVVKALVTSNIHQEQANIALTSGNKVKAEAHATEAAKNQVHAEMIMTKPTPATNVDLSMRHIHPSHMNGKTMVDKQPVRRIMPNPDVHSDLSVVGFHMGDNASYAPTRDEEYEFAKNTMGCKAREHFGNDIPMPVAHEFDSVPDSLKHAIENVAPTKDSDFADYAMFKPMFELKAKKTKEPFEATFDEDYAEYTMSKQESNEAPFNYIDNDDVKKLRQIVTNGAAKADPHADYNFNLAAPYVKSEQHMKQEMKQEMKAIKEKFEATYDEDYADYAMSNDVQLNHIDNDDVKKIRQFVSGAPSDGHADFNFNLTGPFVRDNMVTKPVKEKFEPTYDEDYAPLGSGDDQHKWEGLPHADFDYNNNNSAPFGSILRN